MDQAAIKTLHEQEAFWRAVKVVRDNAPPIPSFDPDNPNAVEEWKAASQKREGFVLALSYLGVNLDD